MKSSVSFYLGLFFLLIVTLSSCKKQNHEEGQGQLQVDFSLNALKSTLADSSLETTLSEVIVTIEDLNGKVVKSEEHIELYNMNGNYISRPLALPSGKYKLTGFLVVDWKNNVIYASPLKGSTNAYLVQNPLPLSFDISKDNVTKVVPEVINAASCKPEDFGYSNFTLNIASTFDFMMGVFIYDDSLQNYKLSSSTISILSDTTDVFNSDLSPNTKGALVSVYDSVGITNKITLPEKFNTFTLEVSKPGYATYTKKFSKEELKLYFRSVDKGPLVVILEKRPSTVPDIVSGLVAYYKFNGDVRDYSRYNNNATYFGNGLYTKGYKSDPNGAIKLNGSTDYLTIKNSSSLNPARQISVCAWYYTTPFYGGGSNPIVCKSGLSNGNLKYQYLLSVTGSIYPNNTSSFNFVAAQTDSALHLPGNNGINTTGYGGGFNYNYFTYDLYKWYFLVGTYDGQNMKLYINGKLMAWLAKSVKFEPNSEDVYIGKIEGSSRSEYDFLDGNIDEVRIYNRALTDAEILSLYQQ